jgi:hypothetical protein
MKTSFHTRTFTTLLVAGLAALAATVAQADTIVGGSVVVASNGNVIATYRGNSASYSNDLYLNNNDPDLFIFNNHGSAVGSTVDLGYFTAGTELLFRLHVNNTGEDFYSGDPSRNIGGYAHARVTSPWGSGETLVEFEDLTYGPFDFNDLSFSFTNTRAEVPSVPDTSSTLGLLALALCGIFGMKRRLK